MKIQTLTKPYLKKNIREILRIDRLEMSGLEEWTEKNFSVDLPNKFQLSLVATDEKTIIGYLIASQKEKSCHIHRISVATDYGGKGVGSKMISGLEKTAKQRKLKVLSVESLKKDILKKFYLKNGFRTLSAKEQKAYSLFKDPKIRDTFLEKNVVYIKKI